MDEEEPSARKRFADEEEPSARKRFADEEEPSAGKESTHTKSHKVSKEKKRIRDAGILSASLGPLQKRKCVKK